MGITNYSYLDNLQTLNFNIEDGCSSSIFLVEELDNYLKCDDVSPYIIIALDRAKNFKADAVYFRFFEDNRSPLPQIYIYDDIQQSRTLEEYAKIHRSIWSASEIPLYFIVKKTSISIFDSRLPVNIKANGELYVEELESIDLTKIAEYAEVIKQYNSQMFNNGSFWESDASSKHFLNNKTVYEKLINSLKCLRESLERQNVLSKELSDKVLILCILVKYLEENGEDINGDNLAHDFFYKNVGFRSLFDVVRNKKIVDLFHCLANHFNGGIFNISERDKLDLNNANLDFLAQFLNGTVDGNQIVLWAEYSFKHIPIELISNFYEEFLPKVKGEDDKTEMKKDSGAVYTPGFLVNFLIDECIPLSRRKFDEKVKLIDVSCGSGIFLVTAFKRLVQRWRIANRVNGKLADTTPLILKKILIKYIYGVDIDNNAASLTIFSLNLSLCSMLTPTQIWTELAFDNLKLTGNITQKDFFDYLIENDPADFDLVVGNPPFKALNENEYRLYEKKLNEKNLVFQHKIPDNQMALMFLDKAVEILKKDGRLCLIMPSGPLLYNNTLAYRKHFFESYNVTQIIDFTFLKSTLFNDVQVGVAALFAEKKLPDNNDLLHVVVNRTKANKEKIFFELDHYNFHSVSRSISKDVDYVWKSNLLGGARVYELISRFRDDVAIQTIGQFLQDNNRHNGWEYGQGYIVGRKNRKFEADYITNRCSVVDRYFTEKGIQKTEIQTSLLFKDRSRKKLFTPPHLLIKKTIGRRGIIPIEFRDDYLTFKNEIIGVHCPINQLAYLKSFEDYLRANNSLFRTLIVATSARSGISRSVYTSLTEDFYNLPYVEDGIKLSESEQIIVDDISEYIIPSFEQGENSRFNKILSNEDNLIFSDFSEVYCNALNSIYKDGDFRYILSCISEGEGYFACEYNYTNADNSLVNDTLDYDLSGYIKNWIGRNALVKRVVRIYSNNKIILVKPKQLRYWLKSVALRDVDETFEEIMLPY